MRTQPDYLHQPACWSPATTVRWVSQATDRRSGSRSHFRPNRQHCSRRTNASSVGSVACRSHLIEILIESAFSLPFSPTDKYKRDFQTSLNWMEYPCRHSSILMKKRLLLCTDELASLANSPNSPIDDAKEQKRIESGLKKAIPEDLRISKRNSDRILNLKGTYRSLSAAGESGSDSMQRTLQRILTEMCCATNEP